MINKLARSLLCFALGIGLAQLSAAQGEIQFSLTVDSADGVSVDGEDAKKGDSIHQGNYDDVTFGDGSSLVVVNDATGVKYRVANLIDLKFLGNAIATSSHGVAIGRWVVGGGAKETRKSTLLATKSDDSTGGASETPGATVKQPKSTTPASSPVPQVKPASTPSAPAASPAGP